MTCQSHITREAQYSKYCVFRLFSSDTKNSQLFRTEHLSQEIKMIKKMAKRDQLFIFSYKLISVALVCFHLFPFHFLLLSHPAISCFTLYFFSRLVSLCNLFNFPVLSFNFSRKFLFPHTRAQTPCLPFFVNTSGM